MKEEKKLKSFGLSTLSVKNRSTVFFITFLIVLFGVVAYNTMPKAAFPDIVLPQIYVGVAYPGNAPLDMEKLITRPIEKEIKSVNDVDKVTSTSTQGYAMVLTEFDSKIAPSIALQRIKDAVDKAKAQPGFPTDLPVEPNIFEMNFSEFPILNVNLSGDYSPQRLKKYAEYLEDELESIDEISKVEIRGIQEKEVEVLVNRYQMEALKISFGDIEQAVSSENLTLAGGEILMGGFKRAIRVVGDISSPSELGDIIVKREAQKIVYLKDIAQIRFGFKAPSSFAREFHKPVLMLDVIKKSGANLLAATDKIYKTIEDAQTDYFPKNLQVTISNDLSTDTRNQVDNLLNSIIFGVLLVVLVLMFFLGLKDAVFVGVAIPLSMLMSFMILAAMGVTINMIVLFSLVLGLGMLVDNGIVVVENVHRLMKEGYPKKQAAIYGVGEIAWPIIASTATTLAAFLPMIFWPGMMGEFMGYLPITLIIVLGSSLFVALAINPALTSFMNIDPIEDVDQKAVKFRNRFLISAIGLFIIVLLGFFGGIDIFEKITPLRVISVFFFVLFGFMFLFYRFFLGMSEKVKNHYLPLLEEKYKVFLATILSGKRPRLIFGGMFVLLFLSFLLIGLFTPKVEFFPINMPKYVNVFIERPVGADIAQVDKITEKIEYKVANLLKKYEITEDSTKQNFLVKSFISQVGEGTSDPAAGPSLGATPNKARIQVSFVEFKDRKGISTQEVLEEIREATTGFAGVSVSIAKDQAGPPMPPPINMELSGEDYHQIMNAGVELKKFIISKNIPGIDNLKLDVDVNKPELIIDIDREKVRRLNLSTYQVAATLRTALYGKEISRYKEKDDEYDINIRLDQRFRNNLEELMNQKITFRDQTNGRVRQIPISSVATPRYTSNFTVVKRKNHKRVVTLFSNVKEGYNANEIVAKIQKEVDAFTFPKGVEYKFTGQQEDQAKEMAFLGTALLIAVFLILLIIVMQFNSIGTPFIIMGSVGFSLIGVFLGLVIFQMDFIIIMTMIGIISLAGVVVNNAIVLLDYTGLLIERKKLDLGLDEDAFLPSKELVESVIMAGSKRLRPVLLTAITTVLGLIPLAVGLNIDFFSLFTDFDPKFYLGGDNVVFWGPMSWTVIFGLSFATFLTLVVVPVMFVLKTNLKRKLMA